MIRWPWVARSTLEEVRDERDRLREQNAELTDQLVRLTRVRNGRPETPKEPQGVDREPIPKELKELVMGFDSKATQVRLVKQLRRRHRNGEPWDRLQEEFEGKLRDGMR